MPASGDAPGPAFPAAAVREYYERNTAGFLRFGRGGTSGAIHRAVWAPGVVSPAEAFHYVDARLAAAVSSLRAWRPVHVVDLGCGVGASLCYLAARLPIRGTGITLSRTQARLAAARLAAAGGTTGRLRCLEGDYCAIPLGHAVADVAYAVESFVHGPSPRAFFAEAHRILVPGGLLLLCDDVRRETTTAAAQRTLARFRRGWHVNTLLSQGELREMAADAGFRHEWTEDLTPWLTPPRLHERLLDPAARLLGGLPFASIRLAGLVGSSALRRGLARGWIGYELAAFRRVT